MAIRINDDCINCGACKAECPNNAIYEPGEEWVYAGKTYGENDSTPQGTTGFFSKDHFYIVPDKCTECVGFFDKPQCAEVCPVDSCIKDDKFVESKEELEIKKKKLDEIGR
ncbi:MAG: 4Fe-4S dicluster domain-containing protein [Ignavibacteriales bacterium]|nr:4Fe-4S dicluster domain-containing protein [Ignavibacteriales bacterium]